MKRPVYSQAGPVVLAWEPAPGQTEADPTELTGRGNVPRLWAAWAYWTVRGGTAFTWTSNPGQANEMVERIWMSAAEARQYLARRSMGGDDFATQCCQDLSKRNSMPPVMIIPKGRQPMLPASGARGWGPYCTRCRLGLSAHRMEGYERVGGRYYGLCDNCNNLETASA